MIPAEWAAGFFDGEGCVNISQSGKTKQTILRVYITNTRRDILDLFRSQFGGRIDQGKKIKGWKQGYNWDVRGPKAIEFLSYIRPFIKLKTSQVDLAFEFWSFMHTPKMERCIVVKTMPMVIKRTPETILRESEFKTQMHELNQRGEDEQHKKEAGGY